jgi:fatty acid amide hydrolase
MSALWQRSASELSALLEKGEVSSREIVRAHLDRIDAADGRIRAFTAVFHDRALADAARADDARKRGERGALLGLPVSIKECFDIAEQATTIGLSSWRDKIAHQDAAMVRALREKGAVVLGRTNLSQTMLFVEARNPLFGQTANPFSLAHTPGGSSGGEAAAIAAGMSPLGVGTDIGGSIRTPAHFSGICGIKPTLDRLPARGQRTVLAGQEVIRSQSGPMARTVADLALFFGALDSRRLSELDGRVPPIAWEDPASVTLKGVRVGMYVDDEVMAPSRAVMRAVERAASALRARGCDVVPFEPPAVPDVVDTYLAALSSDGAETLLTAFGDGEVDPVLGPLRHMATMPDGVRKALAHIASLVGEKRAARMLAAIGEKSVAELWRLTDRLRAYRFTLVDAMDRDRVDLLVCPPYATPALPHGMSKNFTHASSYSMLFNATQLPAGVVPVTRVRSAETERAKPPGVSRAVSEPLLRRRDAVERHAAKVDAASAGLPVGVQVAGRAWDDARVLAAMAAIEADVRGDAEFPRTPVLEV